MGSFTMCDFPVRTPTQKAHLTMPFLTLMTNIKAANLPADLMPKLVNVVAPLMNKPVPAFNWVLDTDKTMSKGPNNANNPYVWLKIEAIGTFQEPENVKMLSPKIFEFFSSEAKVEKEQLLVNFYNLDATHVGSMGTTVAELRK